ncbi:hypothetical protein GCM10010530_67060 [Kribbella aluminosa]
MFSCSLSWSWARHRLRSKVEQSDGVGEAARSAAAACWLSFRAPVPALSATPGTNDGGRSL